MVERKIDAAVRGAGARWHRRMLWAVLAVAPALVAISGCGKSGGSLFKPSIDQQKQAGDQAAQQIAKQYKFVGGDRQARVERVGQRLVNALPAEDRKTWNFQFHVIDDKEVNAFALPGGNVYIFTGLLDRLDNDDELAAVMGHEMTHVRNQHWAGQVAADQERSAGLAVLLGAVKAGNGWYDVAGLANSLVNLRYSRKDEDDADAGGLYNMVAADYNPQGMLDLFTVLQKAGGGGNAPRFLQDHPLTSDRIKHTQERIARLKSGQLAS